MGYDIFSHSALAMVDPSAPSGKDLNYDAGLFAARRRGRALKGSQAFLRLFHAAWQQKSSEAYY